MVDATRMNHHGLGQPATGCSMTTPCCRLNESAPPRNATPRTNLTLPRFHSMEELRQQPQWHGYLNAVFGAESEYTFPVDLNRNTFFYFNALPLEWQRALVARPLMATDATVDSRTGKMHRDYRIKGRRESRHAVYYKERPVKRYHGDWYALFGGDGDGNAGAATAWRYRLPHQSGGHANRSKVEVYHCADKMTSEFWMYEARGSGIFYDVGHTFVVRDAMHLRALNLTHGALRLLGYESVQFTHTYEHGLYKFELLDLRHLPAPALPSASSTASSTAPGGGRSKSESFLEGSDSQKDRHGKRNGPCPAESHAHHFTRGWGGRLPCACQLEVPLALPTARAGARHGSYVMTCLNCGGLDAGAQQSCVL